MDRDGHCLAVIGWSGENRVRRMRSVFYETRRRQSLSWLLHHLPAALCHWWLARSRLISQLLSKMNVCALNSGFSWRGWRRLSPCDEIGAASSLWQSLPRKTSYTEFEIYQQNPEKQECSQLCLSQVRYAQIKGPFRNDSVITAQGRNPRCPTNPTVGGATSLLWHVLKSFQVQDLASHQNGHFLHVESRRDGSISFCSFRREWKGEMRGSLRLCYCFPIEIGMRRIKV